MAEAASRIDRENRYLKISCVFGNNSSQGSSRQETEARYDEVVVYILRKMIYSGRTKGPTEKRINIAVDMSRTFGCIRSKHFLLFRTGCSLYEAGRGCVTSLRAMESCGGGWFKYRQRESA